MSRFLDLHVPGTPLVMPNPWDVGSAVMLQALGAHALASTSAGAAFAQGKQDGDLSLDEMIAAAVAINGATDVPVSADLENGGGQSPDAAAAAVALAAQAGLAGVSIEDLGQIAGDPIYPFDLALARVEAAVDAARAHGIVLTARSEGLLTGTLTLEQVCDRMTAFASAGADVVFAPALASSDDVRAVVKAAGDTPVSVLVGAANTALTVQNLANLGVARISVGSGLARAAYGGALSVIRAALSDGRFDYPQSTASFAEIEALLSPKS
ncbi:isocitrate lyase/phosphoenolpyruvate mutase family protein [uncultured Tateyamaria sp.]|uniref:isocitrate lyase/PEP mutase family protein n=1 Tax=Tateyamaria sp. 1078 TaxID=3417464 RepID=UPI0026092B0A|nr:isocitrate lyase/phosphoenolpyruvate mutase family protein [uncultured Tateyamaria sp.]